MGPYRVDRPCQLRVPRVVDQSRAGPRTSGRRRRVRRSRRPGRGPGSPRTGEIGPVPARMLVCISRSSLGSRCSLSERASSEPDRGPSRAQGAVPQGTMSAGPFGTAGRSWPPSKWHETAETRAGGRLDGGEARPWRRTRTAVKSRSSGGGSMGRRNEQPRRVSSVSLATEIARTTELAGCTTASSSNSTPSMTTWPPTNWSRAESIRRSGALRLADES